MPDGEEPVAEPTLESLQADVRALATAVAQLTARERVVDGEGAHGSGFGQRIAGQPTCSGGAAERPDLLELAQSGRVGAKSVSAEDDYLAVPELLQRAESGYEAVRPVSRVPGLFPLSTDLTNEYLKQDDRRLPAQEEYLWMSCFGAHMAALFVALDELLPYALATNQDFTPYLARARNHAEAIDKAFRFRLAFLRRLNEIKRVHARRRPLLLEWRLQLQVAGVGEDEAVDAGVAAKDAFGSDELGQRTLDLLSSSLSAQTLKSYAIRLSQFAEFCHVSENISPLEATTATVVRRYGHRRACVAAGGRRTRDEGVIWKGDPGDFYMKVIAKKFRGVWHYGVITGVVTEWVLEDYGGATQWRAVFEDGSGKVMVQSGWVMEDCLHHMETFSILNGGPLLEEARVKAIMTEKELRVPRRWTRSLGRGGLDTPRGAKARRPGQRGAKARRPGQRGAKARRPGQRGAKSAAAGAARRQGAAAGAARRQGAAAGAARRQGAAAGQRGAKARRPGQRGAKARRPGQRGAKTAAAGAARRQDSGGRGSAAPRQRIQRNRRKGMHYKLWTAAAENYAVMPQQPQHWLLDTSDLADGGGLRDAGPHD
eukprot:jgi/Tetstr1/449227/TSEL_036432.t1